MTVSLDVELFKDFVVSLPWCRNFMKWGWKTAASVMGNNLVKHLVVLEGTVSSTVADLVQVNEIGLTIAEIVKWMFSGEIIESRIGPVSISMFRLDGDIILVFMKLCLQVNERILNIHLIDEIAVEIDWKIFACFSFEVIFWAQFFGVMPLKNVRLPDPEHVEFRWRSWRLLGTYAFLIWNFVVSVLFLRYLLLIGITPRNTGDYQLK